MYALLVTTSIVPDSPLRVEFASREQRVMWRDDLSEFMRKISSDLGVGGRGITAKCWLLNDRDTYARAVRPEDFAIEVHRQFHDIYAPQ